MTPLPPETRLAFWAPAAHYALAAILLGLAVFHSTFRLTPGLQALCVIVGAVLVIVGTGVYAVHHYGLTKLALTSYAAYLKSVIPDLLGDVNLLKTAGSPHISDAVARLGGQVVALQRSAMDHASQLAAVLEAIHFTPPTTEPVNPPVVPPAPVVPPVAPVASPVAVAVPVAPVAPTP